MRAVLTIALVKRDWLPAYVEACRVYSVASAAEDGCLRFDVVEDDGDLPRICLVETYLDQAAYDVHLASAHFRQWRDEVQDWYAEPPVVIRGTTIPPASER